jgi:Na+/H+ antiporter NhaC
MQDFGILSIVPPVLTIFVALYSRNVIIALIVGILSGSLIITGFNPVYALFDAVENQVLAEFTNGTQSQVLITMMVIGGFVKLLEVSGGAKAFARRMLKIVSTRSKAQLLAWLSGLGIFFTDSGNSLIIGPLPFIGWGAYIMSLIEKTYSEVGLTENAFSVLINVIPYQFYAFLALLTVPIVIMTGKDYGPMKRVQAEYLEVEKYRSAGRGDSTADDDADKTPMGMFLYPLGVMLLLVTVLISWHATHEGITGPHIRSTLIISYLTASLTCMEMMRRHQGRGYVEMLGDFIKGAESLVYVSIVLVLAWSLSSVTTDIHTADYLASLIGDTVSPVYFPMLVFVMGALISLSTGSSYGTFAILMAIAVPVGFQLDASMYLTIAAVLSGGLFGDHCSPISDTTVLASVGADCPHLNHVTTQVAYAGLTGAVTIVAYWMAGVYETPYVLLVAIVILFFSMTMAMRLFGSEAVPDSSLSP